MVTAATTSKALMTAMPCCRTRRSELPGTDVGIACFPVRLAVGAVGKHIDFAVRSGFRY